MTVRTVCTPVAVLGTGAALPGPAIGTRELLAGIDRSFGLGVARLGERLAKRVGIESRHMCRDFARSAEAPRRGDCNHDLAARAVEQALDQAALHPSSIGFLIGHTATPHTLLPAGIAWVADRLGYAGPHVELRQACTGFAAALQLASGMVGEHAVAVVGSETGSVFFDPRSTATDRSQLLNLVQMGDGAGAVVLGKWQGCGPRIEGSFYGSLGTGHSPGIWLDRGGSGGSFGTGVSQFGHDFEAVRKTGPALFDAGAQTAASMGWNAKDMDWVVPHQASAADLGPALAARLGVRPERIVVDCAATGNLGSASILVALHRLRCSGKLKAGDRVLVLGAEASKYMFGGFVYVHADGNALRCEAGDAIGRSAGSAARSGGSLWHGAA